MYFSRRNSRILFLECRLALALTLALALDHPIDSLVALAAPCFQRESLQPARTPCVHIQYCAWAFFRVSGAAARAANAMPAVLSITDLHETPGIRFHWSRCHLSFSPRTYITRASAFALLGTASAS